MKSDEAIRKRIKHREDMFLRRLFGILAKMAKADGRVDAWEAHAAEGAFVRFTRAAERRGFCTKVFNSAKNGRTSIERLAAEFAAKWASAEDCLAVYELLWDIACAKGILGREHKNVLRKACAPLGLPQSYFDIYYRKRSTTFREMGEDGQPGGQTGRRRQTGRDKSSRHDKRSQRERQAPPPPPKTSLQEAYELLGCCSADSDAMVRKAYRDAAKRFHPDLIRARGGTEAQIKNATEMMAKVNAAWDQVKEARGL